MNIERETRGQKKNKNKIQR